MLHKFPPIYFWVTTVALTIAAGLFWLGAFRQVAGVEDLLFLPKADRAIVAPYNAALLMQSSNFKARVQAEVSQEFPDIDFAHAEEGLTLESIVLEGSSILRVTTHESEQSQAKATLTIATKLLLQQLSQYYHFQTELDVRVTDGPLFTTKVTSWLFFVAVSAGTGFGTSVIFFLLLAGLETITLRSKVRTEVKFTPPISADTFRPQVVTPYWSRPEETTFPSKTQVAPQSGLPVDDETASPEVIETYADQYADPNPAEVLAGLPDTLPGLEDDNSILSNATLEDTNADEEMQPARDIPRAMATGPAPDNLPISDLSPLEAATARLYKADIDAAAEALAEVGEASLVSPADAETVSDPQTTEPSPAEYKRRLNELLSGKL